MSPTLACNDDHNDLIKIHKKCFISAYIYVRVLCPSCLPSFECDNAWLYMASPRMMYLGQLIHSEIFLEVRTYNALCNIEESLIF